jgi:secreted Zn-dependent insulinase-like peptidase
VLRIKSLSPDNDNSKLELYIEIGKQTIIATSLAKMAEKFIKPKAFDFLRTQHQLGYSVGSTLTEENGMLGISLYVLSQEKKNKFTKVQAKIVEFIEMVLIEIANISDEDFESLKIARIKNAETDDNSLDEECDRNWSMIHYEFYKFDQNELDAQVTAKLTKNEFIEFVNSFLSAENRRAVFVQVIGNEGDEGEANNEMKMEFMTEKATEDEVLITDIAEFHKNLFLYPELKTLELD